MDCIDIRHDGEGVATLWLARPDRHNAMSAGMIADLTAAAAELGADPAVRVVVLAGQGASFCAGGDLGWMREQMQADAATRRQAATALAMMLRALNDMPKPLVGRVHGNAFGGGVGLISVCDVAVAAPQVRFGLTETRLGLIPATIGPYVLARMGAVRARGLFMSGATFDAGQALGFDLVAQVATDLDRAVRDQARAFLSSAPGAVARAKALARRLGPQIDDAAIAASIDALIQAWQSPEAAHGLAAFFDKRRPDWQS